MANTAEKPTFLGSGLRWNDATGVTSLVCLIPKTEIRSNYPRSLLVQIWVRYNRGSNKDFTSATTDAANSCSVATNGGVSCWIS